METSCDKIGPQVSRGTAGTDVVLPHRGQSGWACPFAGLILVANHVALLAISPQFAYGRLPVIERPTWLLVVLTIVAGAIYFSAIRLPRSPLRPARGWWLWIIAALFFLTPAAYPWYWLCMLPLLAVRPSPGLLILTITLPLYYLRFPLGEVDGSAWFDYGVVAIEFAPAFTLLAWEGLRHRSSIKVRSPLARPEMEALVET